MSEKGSPRKVPNSSKENSTKDTITMSSVIKQSTSPKSSNSATVSPEVSPANLQENISTVQLTGNKSPGSFSCTDSRSKASSPSESIRKTSSLDTIHLKGQELKDYWPLGTLYVDRGTQTNESHCCEEITKNISDSNENRSTKDLEGKNGDDSLCSCSKSISSPRFKAMPMYVPYIPPKASELSSEEGLNEEIQRIVLQKENGTSSHGCPESNLPSRPPAPLGAILANSRSRSVNTQTPKEFDCRSISSEDSSSPDHDSKLGSSPKLNKFSAGEPPDGCERIKLKSLAQPVSLHPQPPPPNFKLKPSLGSAFESLRPRRQPEETPDDLDQDIPPIVPSRPRDE